MRASLQGLIRGGCLLALLVGLTECSHGADWPQWRGPNRDGRSTEKLGKVDWEKNPPKLLWTIEGMGKGYGAVAVVAGRLYATGNTGNAQSVVCCDAATGQHHWTTPITDAAPQHGYDGSRCTPSVDGDRVYVVSSDGGIACLKSENGEVVWKRSFQEFGGRMMSGWGFSESPLVDGDHVLCTPGGADAMIVALDKMTGKDVWRSAMPQIGDRGGDGAGYSSIVISNAAGVKQYVQIVGRGLIGVRASDGKFLWGYNRVANGTANIPTPIPSGNFVFASTGYGTGAALVKLAKSGDGIKADEVYFLEGNVFLNHHGGMVMLGDYVYAGHGDNNGFPICLEWKTGKVKWGGKLRVEGGGGSAAVTLVGDDLLFRYQNGLLALIAASPKGYQLEGTMTPSYQEGESWSHPIVVDGKLYLREQDKLMCYDLKAR